MHCPCCIVWFCFFVCFCLFSVSGCINSEPLKTTSNCNSHGGQILSLHGLGWNHLCQSEPIPASRVVDQRPTMTFDTTACSKLFKQEYTIRVGSTVCSDVIIASPYVINCTLRPGSGNDLDVAIERAAKTNGLEVITMLQAAVSFREIVDFKDKFGRFVEYGVGGLKKEIKELYQRAFASRGELLSCSNEEMS